MKQELVDTKKVFEAMRVIKEQIDLLPLNEHEKIVTLQNLVANELNVLERKNLAAAMFKVLNQRS